MSDKPRRIQRKRTKGWRMPPNTVYVGRPTKWGNPHNINDEDYQILLRATKNGNRSVRKAQLLKQIVSNYRAILIDSPELLSDLSELRGKDLACWCRLDQPCHADVLLELANPDP